jgi:glutathione peroxidase
MQKLVVASLMFFGILATVVAQQFPEEKSVPDVLKFTVKSLIGDDVNLARYQGKVVLFVNVASNCGYTPQYGELQATYAKYKEKGLVILGFPANNFKNQEPGTNAEIAEFCKLNYGVSFDMFSKISVLGDDKAPLYKFLTEEKTNPQFSGDVKWNFEKFLVGRDGKIVGRYLSAVKPTGDEMTQAIERELAKSAGSVN